MLFARRIPSRLALGWVVGTVVSAIGCSLSYYKVLPSGPTIVACFGGFLVVAGLVHYVWVVGAASRGAAFARVAGGTLAFALLVAGSFLLEKKEHHDVIRLLETGSKAEKMLA